MEHLELHDGLALWYHKGKLPTPLSYQTMLLQFQLLLKLMLLDHQFHLVKAAVSCQRLRCPEEVSLVDHEACLRWRNK